MEQIFCWNILEDWKAWRDFIIFLWGDILSYKIADIHRISIEMAADVAAAIGSANESPSYDLCALGCTGRPGLSCNFIAIFLIYGDYIITSRYSAAPGENMQFCPFKLSAYYMYITRAPIMLNWILRGIVSA